MINDHLSKNPDILPNSKNPPRQNPVKEDMSGKNRTYGNPTLMVIQNALIYTRQETYQACTLSQNDIMSLGYSVFHNL